MNFGVAFILLGGFMLVLVSIWEWNIIFEKIIATTGMAAIFVGVWRLYKSVENY